MRKEFKFECPKCGAPLKCSTCSEEIHNIWGAQNFLNSGGKYCYNCGKEIASTLMKALAKCEG